MKKQLVVSMVLAATLGAGQLFGQAAPQERKIFSCAASYRVANLAKVEKSYVGALQCENDGVVESALAHLTRMKLCLPGKRFPLIEATLASLAKSGRTPAIRYKAYLASMVYDTPEVFAHEQTVEFGTPDELYSAISRRIQSSLLGFNDAENVRPE